MTRRALLATLAGALLDPERWLWRPGRKLISIPSPKVLDLRLYAGMVDLRGLFNPRIDIARLYNEHRDIIIQRLQDPLRPSTFLPEWPEGLRLTETMTRAEFRRRYP